MFLKRLAIALQQSNINYALVGGYAVALHGAVRGTIDIDLVIALEHEQFIKLEKALGTLGLKSHLPITAEEVFNFREEYIKRRNLVAWKFVNEKNAVEIVNVIITCDANEMDAVNIQLEDLKIPVVTKEALIDMKKASTRLQDLVDVVALQKLR